MADAGIIDVHMHVYRTPEEGIEARDAPLSPEYGDIHAHSSLSRYSGDAPSAQEAIEEAGLTRAVVVHLFRPLGRRHDRVAELPKEMDETARERAIAEIDADVGTRLKESNFWFCEMARSYPVMAPYVSIDPWVLGPEEAADHLRDLAENHGARGIKLHPVRQRFHVNDQRMWPTYRVCVEMGLSVVSHSGPSQGAEQHGDPRAYIHVLRAFPDLTMVAAHMGGGAWTQVPELVEACSNALFDCSEIIDWFGAPNAPTERQLAQLIRDVGAQRFMMGSDFPWWAPAHCAERVMGLPLLSAEEKEMILGANAARLLSLG